MTAYYNENDPFAAAWLRNLIAEGLIADGVVDERSITEVSPRDLVGFTQRHFFAGIGGWSYALRLAGWPDDRPVWTGSCPCQPFSQAGKQRGNTDERHLWPEFQRLIAECSPPTVFGEQVASRLGREWLAGVRADLEALGYGVGAADLCAAGVGAPHIRQRLYWVADADGGFARDGELQSGRQYRQQQEDRHAGERLGDTAQQQQHRSGNARSRRRDEPSNTSYVGGLGNTSGERLSQRPGTDFGREAIRNKRTAIAAASPWSREILIFCLDGKFRHAPANEKGELEPALFPLAHGVPNRVGTLRGAGNAIVPQVAAEFIKACM